MSNFLALQAPRERHCAIYTRLSLDPRADHQFSSLEAQRYLFGLHCEPAAKRLDGGKEALRRFWEEWRRPKAPRVAGANLRCGKRTSA